MEDAGALPGAPGLSVLRCGCGDWTSLGSPEGLLKQGSWSPRRLGLPSLGAHRKSNSPKFLAAPGPGKIGGRKKKEKKRFRPGSEMSLLVSGVRLWRK